MNLENYIEGQYRDLMDSSELNTEYADLYKTIKHQKLREIFMTLHHDLILLFKTMNERLPTDTSVGAHFWAEPSRDLIKRIDIIFGLMNTLKGTELAFEIDEYYFKLLEQCRGFLRPSGGSELPANMSKVDLYYMIPIFKPINSITIPHEKRDVTFELKFVGAGSYANVYKYKDTFFSKNQAET